jgi:peptidyl-prolyl cis-trans isomerase B (cyclophilin B)
MFMLLLTAMVSLSQICFSQPEEHNAMTSKKNPLVVIKTNKGLIEVELYTDKAPLTVENFMKYVDAGHYNNTIFHRVIPNFMIQGGGMTPDFNQKPTYTPIKNEANNGLKNLKGTIAMARTSDPDSATAQFYINLVDNPFLDYKSSTPSGWGYAVFGKVVEGINVVEQIGKVQTGSHGQHRDVPEEPVIIESITEVK